MKLLKKFLPYLVYLGVLLAVILVSAAVVYWMEMAKLVFLTLAAGGCFLVMLFMICAAVTLH